MKPYTNIKNETREDIFWNLWIGECIIDPEDSLIYRIPILTNICWGTYIPKRIWTDIIRRKMSNIENLGHYLKVHKDCQGYMEM